MRKTVLITGASSGIGFELVKIFARKNYDLVLVARNESRLYKIKRVIEENSRNRVYVIVKDLSLEGAAKDIYEYVNKNNIKVDVLVNNAGFGDYGVFAKCDIERQSEMISVNVKALTELTYYFVKPMVARGSGKILNLGSIASFMPGPLMSVYYATKSYVVRLSEAINEELRRKKSKVKISILCPGPVVTNFEKTANIKFNFHGISSKKVAEYTVNHLNKFYIVPTCIVKIGKFFARKLSGKKVAKVIYTLQKKRSDKK